MIGKLKKYLKYSLLALLIVVLVSAVGYYVGVVPFVFIKIGGVSMQLIVFGLIVYFILWIVGKVKS